jgi:L-ribulose-5-phosphate 4-epimerase
MKFAELREQVYEANSKLGTSGLVVLTWGNVSGIDPTRSYMAIKPSGVSYDDLKPEDIVVLELETGKVVAGDMRPSSDTPTHLVLYRQFAEVFGIVHTHSPYAVGWAQANESIPAFGTTHADTFYGPVPVTRLLTQEEVRIDYELNTGKVIAEHFSVSHIDPLAVPAVLVAQHGPFTWGPSPEKAVTNAVVLEEAAKMALFTRQVRAAAEAVPDFLLEKHYRRKHGPDAYYGQK